MKNNNTVPPTREATLNHLRVRMNQFRARYTNNQSNAQNSTASAIGVVRQYNFYISYENMRGAAFCVAYNAAKQSKNNKELCAFFGSMICDVFPDLRSSMKAALNGIGVNIFLESCSLSFRGLCSLSSGGPGVPAMDGTSIHVYFGCCILILLKKTNDDEEYYKTFMSSSIREMREKVGCDPDADFVIPFGFKRANAIRTMLGVSSKLRADVIQYLMGVANQGDTGISSVCQYLCNKLSWSEMHHFTRINDLLVKPLSPVLLDPRVSAEVDNLMEACDAIASHPNPQFYMYLASNVDLVKVEPSRFPTLIAVAQELEKGNNNGSTVPGSTVPDSEAILTVGSNPVTVQALVQRHRKFMPQN